MYDFVKWISSDFVLTYSEKNLFAYYFFSSLVNFQEVIGKSIHPGLCLPLYTLPEK